MESSSERSNNSALKVMILLFLMEIFVLLFLTPTAWMHKIIESENALIQEEMGESTTKWIKKTGANWYSGLFVRSGLEHDINEYFMTDDSPQALGQGLTTWFSSRAEAFRTIAHQVLQRLALVYSWTLFFIFLAIPFIWDGTMQRKIKQHSFAHTSTAYRSMAVSSFGPVAIFLLMALFAPVPFHPTMIPFFMVLVLIAINITISHTQKEL